MSLLAVAFPHIEKKDFDWIQSIRESQDERYFRIINPHFTIVFPTEIIDEKTFVKHVKTVAKKFKEYYFVLRCAQIVKDSFSDYTDLFLVPEEGYRIFVKLHDAMYTGPLSKELRLDIPFIPHIGIAGNKDPFRCKIIADQINKDNIEIVGSVGELSILSYDNKSITTIEKIVL